MEHSTALGAYIVIASVVANLAKSLDLTQRTNPSDMDDIFPLDLPIPTASWPPEQTPLVDQTSGTIAKLYITQYTIFFVKQPT